MNTNPIAGIRHYEETRELAAAPEAVFALLDGQTRLARHMAKPSAMMGGGRMTYAFDEGGGMTVGSHIRMGGTAFGITLEVDEVVTDRDPPRTKRWETVGTPRLLIIGSYAMGFELTPAPSGSKVRVWIDYALPNGWLARLLGWIFAGFYARWCVGRMLSDAARAFVGDEPRT